MKTLLAFYLFKVHADIVNIHPSRVNFFLISSCVWPLLSVIGHYLLLLVVSNYVCMFKIFESKVNCGAKKSFRHGKHEMRFPKWKPNI